MNKSRSSEKRRNFKSDIIDAKTKEITSFIVDKELSDLFLNCFSNTLNECVYFFDKRGKPDTYILTGDIPAMWLRDSAAQVWPYLEFVNEDEKLKDLFRGLIRRQADCILLDPYANAFRRGRGGASRIFERKWELDSLCYFIRLSYHYWRVSDDADIFDAKWQKAASSILETFKEQSNFDKMAVYRYESGDDCPNILSLSGFGNPLAETALIRSAFRPSDDACIFQYNVPANCFAAVSLEQLAEIFSIVFGNKSEAVFCAQKSVAVKKDLMEYAVFKNKKGKKIFAYEIDGYGGAVFMDDANAPGLLSLPYFGFLKKEEELYQNTRKMILSEKNPYYFKGEKYCGIGSAHTRYGNIWPLSIIMQAITSDSEEEIITCLKTLKSTHAGKHLMHESFKKNNPENYSRSWFAWANSLFGELILKLYRENREILKKI